MSLEEDGINIGLATAGLFGSLMCMSKTASLNIGRTIISTVGGAASANYLTPLILHITKLGDDSAYAHAIAFLLGFAGLRAIEKLTQGILPNEPTHTRKRSR
jgi:hypothetical protein